MDAVFTACYRGRWGPSTTIGPQLSRTILCFAELQQRTYGFDAMQIDVNGYRWFWRRKK